jgi:hypothetical protein
MAAAKLALPPRGLWRVGIHAEEPMFDLILPTVVGRCRGQGR